MKPIYDSSKTSAELAGVEKEIKKALLKIYKEYTKIVGRENNTYLAMFISTTDEGTIVISANNAYFGKDRKNALNLWEEYEK